MNREDALSEREILQSVNEGDFVEVDLTRGQSNLDDVYTNTATTMIDASGIYKSARRTSR